MIVCFQLFVDKKAGSKEKNVKIQSSEQRHKISQNDGHEKTHHDV